MRLAFLATLFSLLALSLNASVLMTNPIPVSGSGDLLNVTSFTQVAIDFTGNNSQGDSVRVSVQMPDSDCFSENGILGECAFTGGALFVDGYPYGDSSLVFSPGPLISFFNPFPVPPGVPPPPATEVMVPLSAVFIYGTPVESCGNSGAVPPLCGYPVPVPCGGELGGCIVTNTFRIVPTPEPSAVLLLALSILCLLIKVRVAPTRRETVRMPGTIWEHRRAENSLIYPKRS
jgi:hypothetical protein